jgi:hypothetical protein
MRRVRVSSTGYRPNCHTPIHALCPSSTHYSRDAIAKLAQYLNQELVETEFVCGVNVLRSTVIVQ